MNPEDDMNQRKDRIKEKVEEVNDMDKQKLLSRELQDIYTNKQNEARFSHFESPKKGSGSVHSKMKNSSVPSSPYKMIFEDDTASHCYRTGFKVNSSIYVTYICSYHVLFISCILYLFRLERSVH